MRGLVTTIVWGSAVMGLGFSAYYALTALYPTFVQKELGLTVEQMAKHVQLFQVGMLVGAIACGVVAARRGVIVAVAVPALLALGVLPLYVGTLAGLAGARRACSCGVIGAGYAGVTPLLLTSLFPAHIRARCVGLVYHVGACAGAFVPTAIAALSEYAGLTLGRAILLVAGSAQIALVAALMLRPRGTARSPAPPRAQTRRPDLTPAMAREPEA